MKKMSTNLPPLKKRKPRKKSQEKEVGIKIKLHKADKYGNASKFQIHWNKLDWVNPSSCDERKNPFLCVL